MEVSTPLSRYFTMEPNEYVKEYFKSFQETVPMVKHNLVSEDVNALLIFAPKKFDDEIYKDIDPSIKGIRFTEYGIDIRTHEISKADGINKVLDYYGFKKDNAMSFGDSYHGDIDMLNATKYSIAMGNGDEELKQHAFFVTKHIKNHGVKHALKIMKIL